MCRDFQNFWFFYSLKLVAERLLSHLSNYRFGAIAGTDCQVKSEALQLIPAVPYLLNKSRKGEQRYVRSVASASVAEESSGYGYCSLVPVGLAGVPQPADPVLRSE